MRACLIGIIGLKKKQVDLMGVIKKTITEAEEQVNNALIESNAPMTSANLVVNEVGRLYEECSREKYRQMSLDDRSQKKLFSMIECSDIDSFCEEIWGFKASEKYKTTSLY